MSSTFLAFKEDTTINYPLLYIYGILIFCDKFFLNNQKSNAFIIVIDKHKQNNNQGEAIL